jgi:hypothetical protein
MTGRDSGQVNLSEVAAETDRATQRRRKITQKDRAAGPFRNQPL